MFEELWTIENLKIDLRKCEHLRKSDFAHWNRWHPVATDVSGRSHHVIVCLSPQAQSQNSTAQRR